MYRKPLLISLYLLHSLFCYSQSLLSPREILLQRDIATNTKAFEFSSLAIWRDKLLLVPALKNPGDAYTIDTTEINKSLSDRKYVVRHNSISFDPTLFRDSFSLIPGFDGIEAVVTDRDTLYFSIETKEGNDSCYVIKAYIAHDSTIIPVRRIAFPKPVGYESDGGFENMMWLNQTSLLVVFEYLDRNKAAFAFQIDKDLNKANLLSFPAFPKRRLTDLYAISDSTCIGINSYYKRTDPNCYSQFLFIDFKNNVTIVKRPPIYKNSCPHNWEGIVPYRNGALVISDNKYVSTDETKLVFYKLN